MQIKPMGPVLGAEIREVDLGNLSDSEFVTIRSALVEHEVLVFPDQPISTQAHVDFGRRFGELTVSPFSPNADDIAELIVLDNHPGNPSPLTDIWHSDETYRESPPLTTILRARIVPAFGGDTMFASMTAAYEGLSERMQMYLSGMTALHGFGRWYPFGFSWPITMLKPPISVQNGRCALASFGERALRGLAVTRATVGSSAACR